MVHRKHHQKPVFWEARNKALVRRFSDPAYAFIHTSILQTLGETIGDNTTWVEFGRAPDHLTQSLLADTQPLATVHGERSILEVIVQRIAIQHPNISHEHGSLTLPVSTQQTTMCNGCTNTRETSSTPEVNADVAPGNVQAQIIPVIVQE